MKLEQVVITEDEVKTVEVEIKPGQSVELLVRCFTGEWADFSPVGLLELDGEYAAKLLATVEELGKLKGRKDIVGPDYFSTFNYRVDFRDGGTATEDSEAEAVITMMDESSLEVLLLTTEQAESIRDTTEDIRTEVDLLYVASEGIHWEASEKYSNQSVETTYVPTDLLKALAGQD